MTRLPGARDRVAHTRLERQASLMTTNDLVRDLEIAGDWWARLVAQVPEDVVGLWFGIVDLDRAGVLRRELYVAGSRVFDCEDETAEWACDPEWWPENRYVWLPGLKVEADYLDVLAYATALVDTLRPQDLVTHELAGVGVGFDDGDFNLTWTAAPTS